MPLSTRDLHRNIGLGLLYCWLLLPGYMAWGVQPVTLTAWTESVATPVMREWIADFQEEYPWISIEFQGIDNETWEETLRTAMYSASPPDILIIESRAELVEYVRAHLLADLTVWYDARVARFMNGYELYSMIHGRRYAIPWDMLVLDLIWYNPRMLEKYHLDPATINTWDDLLDVCAILKEAGETPFAFGGGGAGWTSGHWVMFLLQKKFSQEDILKLARGEKHWTDPDVMEALSHFEELVHNGYVAADAAIHDQSAGRALYFKGQGAFWQAGSWHLFTKGTPDAPPEWEYRFIPFPMFVETPERNVAISTINWNWAIAEHSHHKKEALLFLDYITRPDIAELWVSTLHWFLTIRGAVNERTASPEMLAISRYLESATVVPGLEHFFHRQVVQDGHWKGALDVLSGKLTTRQWAERIEERQKASGVLPLD